MVKELYFSQQIEAAKARLEKLEHQVGLEQQSQAEEALLELSITLDELQVAEEELHQQHEELIAARQMAELERERYQDLFDFAPDGYLVTDPEGVIREANRVAAILLQASQKYLIGKPLVLFVAPKNRRTFLNNLLEMQADGKVQSWELQMQSRNALSFYAAITVAAKRDAVGRLTSLRWLIHDITQHKRAEETLRESEAFNQAILGSLAAHIAVLDKAGTIVAVNEAWERFARKNSPSSNLTGVGMNYLEVCRQARGESAEGAEQVLAGIQAVLEGSLPHFSLEYPCHSPVTKRWFLLNVTPLSKSGYGAVISHQDITEQKLMEEEKGRLLEEVSQQRKQLRAVSGQLAEVQEKERKRLAQELHDQVGRNLTALGLNLNIIETHLAKVKLEGGSVETLLTDSVVLIEDTTESIRAVMAELRPPVLDEFGLVAALKWYAAQLASRRGLTIIVQSQELSPRLDLKLENVLFRIAQEALTNVIKHAQATQATVALEVDDERVKLVIADNGIGIEAARPAQNGGPPTWGLLTMAERAEAAGGHCWVESGPDDGTRVVVEISPAAL